MQRNVLFSLDYIRLGCSGRRCNSKGKCSRGMQEDEEERAQEKGEVQEVEKGEMQEVENGGGGVGVEGGDDTGGGSAEVRGGKHTGVGGGAGV